MKRMMMFLVAGAAALTGLAVEDLAVEFTGTQCVDTGYYVTGETAIVADFQLLDTETTQQLVWSAGTKMWNRFYVSGEKKWSWSCQNTGTGDASKDAKNDNASTGVAVDGDRLVATVDGYRNHVVLVKNGTVLHERTADWTGWADYPHTETSSESLKIGCRFAENRFYAKMKLYSFKIYEKGELVRDYIPATREGIVGLYDKKNGGFVFDTRFPVGSGDHALVAHGDLPAYEGTDAYIESDGTSAMNARIRATDDVRVEVDYAYRDLTQQQRVFGADGRPCLYINWEGLLTFTTGSSAKMYTTTLAADTLRHTAVVDYPNHKMEIITGPTKNMSWDTEDTTEGASPMPFALFGNMNEASGTYDDGFKFRHQAKVRIYGARFYRAGELVHDYRPCVKGGVAGFKDAVDGGFICGENADAFTAGGDVERLGDDPYVLLAGNNGNAGAKKWINTGYYPGPTSRIVLDYALADNYPGSGQWFIMCAYTAAAGDQAAERLNFIADATSAVQWRNGTGSTWAPLSAKLAPATTQRNVRRQLDYDAASGTCTLSTAGFVNKEATSSATLTRTMSTYTLRLGGDTAATTANFAPLKVYGLKIYEGGTLVHDYAPYVKNGVVGLQDAKTDTFLCDASATKAALDAGGRIATDAVSAKDAYLEFTGAQSIDTDIKPTGNTAVVADFQLTSTAYGTQQFIWGSSNDTSDRIYTANTGKWGWFGGWDATKTGGTITTVALDLGRLQVTVDPYNQTTHFDREGQVLYSSTTFAAAGTSCASSIKIGSRFEANNGQWNFAKMKLYSFKIYEAGELVRDYVPYVQNGEAGLWDKVNGEFAPNMQGGVPFKVGGIGADLQPMTDVEIPYGKSRTLSAAASGAIGYRWYLNGELLAGVTGPTCTIDWRKGKPETDEVKSVAFFDVFGVEETRETTITVTHRKCGLTLILR